MNFKNEVYVISKMYLAEKYHNFINMCVCVRDVIENFPQISTYTNTTVKTEKTKR